MSPSRKAPEHDPDRPSRSAEHHARAVMAYIRDGLFRLRIADLSPLQAEIVRTIVREQFEWLIRGRKGKRVPEPREKKRHSFDMEVFETVLICLYGEKKASKISLLDTTGCLVSVGITDDSALLEFYNAFLSSLPQGFYSRFGTIAYRVFQHSKARYEKNTQKQFPKGIGINTMQLLGEYLIHRGLLDK